MKNRRYLPWVSFLSVVILLSSCQSTPPKEGSAAGPRPTSEFLAQTHLEMKKYNYGPDCCTAKGKSIAIASGGNLSASAGMEIHKQGGNAVDVAVATAFALCVERVYSTSIGGGGFATLHLVDPKVKGDYFVDFRETAPRLVKPGMFMGKNGEPNSKLSQDGGLAVATPGVVAGLFDLHQKWGKLPWKQLLQPAIRLAQNGFPVFHGLANRIERKREALLEDPYLTKFLFKKGKQPLKVGDLLVQRELAKTLTEIAQHGKKGFYSGRVAAAMVKAVKARGGIMDATDLKNYETRFRTPVTATFGNYQLISAPPPSSGGIVAAQVLGVLASFDLAKQSQDSARFIHLVAEALKRGYADRSEYVGDPDFFKKDYASLLTPEYIEQIRSRLNLEKATPSSEVKPGEFIRPRTSGTTNADVIDAEGNAVSLTISTNGPFGASVGVPGTGILMNDTMDDFTLKAGEKNMWGVTTGDGNLIAPGKRPLSSMMPTILLSKDTNRPLLALGGAGGSRIISGVIEVILNDLYVMKGDLKASIFAPRFHHQWVPDELVIEGFSEDTKARAKAMGYVVVSENDFSDIIAVSKDPATNDLVSVFDPRVEGGALAE